MNDSISYTLVTIEDLLKVPAERRAVCVKEILVALEFWALASVEHGIEFEAITWTDNGSMSCTIRDQDGSEFLRLEGGA